MIRLIGERRSTPHFVPDPDNVVLNVRERDRGVRGNGYSLLVPEMPLALSHGRVGACTAQEQHRASQRCPCIAQYYRSVTTLKFWTKFAT